MAWNEHFCVRAIVSLLRDALYHGRKSPTRRNKRVVAVGALLVFSGAVCAEPAHFTANNPQLDLNCKGCNVIFLNFDFLRADRVGPSAARSLTPNIDAYFENAIVFEDVSSPAGSSYRGNLSVLTGTEPHWYGLDVHTFERLKSRRALGPWEDIYIAHPTIGQILGASGYHTVYLNKGHRSGKRTFLDRGITDYRDFPLQTLFEDSLPSLQSVLANARPPFFVLFHAIPTRLHTPYYPLDRPRKTGDHIIYTKYKMHNRDYGYKVTRNRKISNAQQRLAEQEIYDQQLVYADDKLAAVFEDLRRLENNTIIVFYSDHGTQLGDKGIFASNGVSFEQCVRVPLFIKHPRIKRRLIVKTPISLIDLVATIYDMVGVRAPDGMDARSLLPVIRGDAYHRKYMVGLNDPDEYIREGYWKLILTPRRKHELYDIRVDPGRKDNRYYLEGERASNLYYLVNFFTPWNNEIRDGGWVMRLDRSWDLKLFDLKNDPLETSDLAEHYPEITKRLLHALERIKHAIDERRLDLAREKAH